MAIGGAEIEQPLDSDQLRKIRHGLRNSLRVRNFDEASIDRYAEEAISDSSVEFAKARKDGKDIPNPVAWVIKVAIWRSIDRLRREEREALAGVALDEISELADPVGVAPEEAALDNIEAAELHRVVSSLPWDQREALRSYYFFELSTRAAAKQLHWSEPTFRRRLKAAMCSLRDRFGVPEQGGPFGIELGLAASISLASAGGASAGGLGDHLAATGEEAPSAISHVARRVRDLLDRLISGTGPGRDHAIDPAVVNRAAETASGPSGAMAGKLIGGGCAFVVAAACAATGVVGPGIGGVALLHGGNHKTVAPKLKAALPPKVTSSRKTPRPQPQVGHRGSAASPRRAAHASEASASSERALGDESGTTAERTHSSTRSLGVESEATPPEPVTPAPAPETPSAPASNPTQESNSQFAP